MASFRAFTFSLIVFLAPWLASAAGQNHHDTYRELHLHGQDSVSNNASLLAPYHRNISAAGAAWVVVPNRDMRCQCLNPDETCCMPKSKGLAPFCIPKGSACCSDTFCTADETCCADACCKADTTCTYSGTEPGCCPHGKTCSGPVTCYDLFSPKCYTYSLASLCCIPRSPFCRHFPPSGLGCYASSTQTLAGTATTRVGSTSVDGIIMIPWVPTSGTQPVSSTTRTVEAFTTVTETITLEAVGSAKFSTIVTQTIPLPENPTITPLSSSATSFPTTTSSPPKSKSKSKPPLCFNADSQSPVACTSISTSSSSPSPSSSDSDPSIPGQIILRSQASFSSPSSSLLLFITTISMLLLTT